MNENLNLVEILKDCQIGTKLYSPLFGEVTFKYIRENYVYTIVLSYLDNNGNITSSCFTKDGRYVDSANGECVLFPAKDQRDWSKFKASKPKFDPKTLKSFDRVLVSYGESNWKCKLFSHIDNNESKYKYDCCDALYEYCIPYNEETKHLVGTTDEAPEYYRYWED